MADEKKTVKETAENGKMNKFVAFFKNLPQFLFHANTPYSMPSLPVEL